MSTGKERAFARSRARSVAVQKLYADTPDHPPSRQVKRAEQRRIAKVVASRKKQAARAETRAARRRSA